MIFTADYLLQQLLRQPVAACYWVAFSGGLDSQVLLHALYQLREVLDASIGAVHVNHGLQPAADDWATHCRQVCADPHIPFVSLQVDGRALRGESPEAAARAARYAVLADWLPANDCLLTAQHQDDQAETLLLQLLRGSGVNGLAAMPSSAILGAGRHLRPLLDVRRDALRQYASALNLSWIEDPSNADTAFDRNYLRQEVLPILQQRWPSAAASMARSAGHCAEAAELLGNLAERELQALVSGDNTLSLPGLLDLPPLRQRNVMRHWIKQLTGATLSAAVLARIFNDVIGSRSDSEPCVRWSRFEMRRFRNELFLLPQTSQLHPTGALDWTLAEPLVLPLASGVLTADPVTGGGLRADAVIAGKVSVSWRQGGEIFQPVGRGHHHRLKKLFQEQGIPPWVRSRIPLIYVQDQLAAVADLWVSEVFQAGPAEHGFSIHWLPQPQAAD
jgi:tRNA(Ile)-lysidine synthase